MRIFLSYGRAHAPAALALHGYLAQAKHAVWMDGSVEGGQLWWDTILDNIRSCDLFVVALSAASTISPWCRLELEYAAALDRPVLPVIVDSINPVVTPEAIRRRAPVRFDPPTPEAVIALLNAVARQPPSTPLPATLPPEPADPTDELGPLRAEIGADELSFSRQRQICDTLVRLLANPDLQALVADLLRDLRDREDVSASIARRIDDALILRSRPHGLRGDLARSESLDLLRSLATHIDEGRCTPVVGFGLTDSLIGSRRQLARRWVETFEFPMARGPVDDLPRVAQFVSVMTNPAVLRASLDAYLRDQLRESDAPGPAGRRGTESLGELLRKRWERRLTAHEPEPHMVLAGLDCPVYVNAHPAGLLTEALYRVGKQPAVELCYWRADVDDWPQSVFELDRDYVPSIERPLVFQVFGALGVPESVPHTTDDYFDFLQAVASNRAIIPSVVRRVLADSALLILGFELEDWDLRVLLRSLVNQEGSLRLRGYRHVAAQIDLADTAISPARARQYLERYFGVYRRPSIDLFWGTPDQLTTGLAAVRREAQ